MSTVLAYIPGQPQPHPTPLARFLPRLQQNVVSTWLHETLPPGSVVLDPFGASPHLAVEAAQAGYRVIIAANNPIFRFLIELAANPPQERELQAALAALAAARRGDERLELHLLDLYRTNCPDCSYLINAERFLWERDAEQPHAKVLTCPHCQAAGEFPTDAFDHQNARKFTRGGPNYARALERVAPMGDPNRTYTEEALSAYPPRAVYALFNLINKLPAVRLKSDPVALSALMLAACDRASALWPVKKGKRPRQLLTPSAYFEHNIWLALESAIPLWATGAEDVALSNWPELPPESGGICIYEGRLKQLAEQLEDVQVGAVVSALPRPNQAFWTLSALWAGWLWGREAIGPFTSVLKRRRYDWAWHTTALNQTMQSLTPVMGADAPFLGLITESEAGFDTAAILAAELAGLRLTSIAARPEEGQTQIIWQQQTAQAEEEQPLTFSRAAHTLLLKRGQPSSYLLMQDAALSGWAHSLAQPDPDMPATELFTQTRDNLAVAFRYQDGFLRFGGTEKDPTSGLWWLREDQHADEPLADRVEKWLVGQLVQSPGQDFASLDKAACGAFTGLQTPPLALLKGILASYGEEQQGGWHLQPGEKPAKRRADLEEIRALLRAIGQQLQYHVEGEETITWIDGNTRLTFYCIASAVLGEVFHSTAEDDGDQFIVLPGSRAKLVLDKLAANPHLAQLADDWHFLKFRLLRRMGENSTLTRELFWENITLDPLSASSSQLPLF